jgi:hypothetical protein
VTNSADLMIMMGSCLWILVSGGWSPFASQWCRITIDTRCSIFDDLYIRIRQNVIEYRESNIEYL